MGNEAILGRRLISDLVHQRRWWILAVLCLIPAAARRGVEELEAGYEAARAASPDGASTGASVEGRVSIAAGVPLNLAYAPVEPSSDDDRHG
jgi:hypothetical protein